MMPPKAKRRLTEDEKLRRRAARKAAAINARIKADVGPLFVEQVPAEELTNTNAEYWRIRKSFADCPRGEEAAYLGGIDAKVDLMIIRNLARRVMPAADFALAVEREDRFGSRLDFWRNILLGRKQIVLRYWRHVYGCRSITPYYGGPPFMVEKRIEIGEALVWPPPGYQAPLTPEELAAYLMLPLPADLPGAVDPLGLASAAGS